MSIGPALPENYGHVPTPADGKKKPLREVQNTAREQLKRTAENIQKIAEPLKPLVSGSTNPSDVYFVDDAIFKPGQEEHVKKALTCRSVAKIIGLEHCVPRTIEAKAAELLSHQDLDEEGIPLTYDSATVDGKPYLIDITNSSQIESQDDNRITFLDGSTITVDDGEVVEADEHSPFDEGEEVIIALVEDVPYLVAKEDAHPVVEEGSPHVRRGSSRFDLKQSDDAMLLVAKDVLGMLQTKVKNVVTKINGQEINIRELAQKDPKKLLQAFFSKIDSKSFAESVILATLFRTQDGKANSLDDTNFLFSDDTGKLTLTLIDFDETWPTSNAFVQDPEIVQRAGGDVAPIRLGLLAYPQAHSPLTGEVKEHVTKILHTITSKRAELVQEAKNKLQDDKAVSAFEELLDRMGALQATPSSLKELVFALFPTYKAQWELLEKNNVPREDIADQLGYGGLSELKRRFRIK